MNKALFGLYLFFTVYVSSLRELNLLLLLFFVLFSVLFALKRRRLKGFFKGFLYTALFSLMLSLPYSLWSSSFDYSIMMLLRVLNLYMLTLMFISTVNLYSLLSFSKTLSFLLVISVSFTLAYRRVFENFQQALRSRSIEKPKRQELLNFLRRIMGYFFERALRDGQEVTMAMKSRGFDHD
ncbi:MAG: CbiQ family ECF transporter T component [Aquificaceae bacterium]|nr:energy-coupling factor transporter transmembrane protein EcfT [Aquificaceae bacterium]MDW8032412.1 CbiQ family ECF transporter T component [Aquificaceae bacterium]MDW8424164.1 CbiQ family ECF transporter T component [Aquificaceae bacterium]